MNSEKVLESMRLINFQSHKDTFLEFSPGLNVILGKSDQGKSSIARGFDWGVRNKPSGNSFRRHDTKETRIDLNFEDGIVVREKKGVAHNVYKLIANGMEEEFKNLKKPRVPDVVNNFLNMGDVNIQTQHSPHFMLSQTGSKVAKQFNEVVDLEIIDKTIASISSLIKKNGANRSECESTIEDLFEKAQMIPDIAGVEDKIDEAESIYEKAKALIDKAEQIESLADKLKAADNDLQELPCTKDLDDDFNTAIALTNEVESIEDLIESIEDLVEDWEASIKDCKTLKAQRDALIKSLPEVCPTCGKVL